MPKEIERKYIVNQMPENPGEALAIRQGYLLISEDGSELRIRKYGDTCFQTLKSNGHLERHEIEIEISLEQFEELWPFTSGKRVFKKRYRYSENEFVYELDVYENPHEGLIIAEVEFRDRKKSENFKPPAWLGREVTEDPDFKNRNLAT